MSEPPDWSASSSNTTPTWQGLRHVPCADRGMPAKAKVADFIGRFYAEQRRDAAARRGIALAESGKKKEAREAEREANKWDREAKRLGRG